MRKVILFIAMSLDGYIADNNGNVDWLLGHGNDSENIDIYSEFIQGVDTILMGWNTYHQITTDLSPTEWIYADLTTYVITHHKMNNSEHIYFTDEAPAALLDRLKSTDGKNIWICSGANLVQQLMCDDLIDQYHISVIPTILGSGVQLFNNSAKEIKLKLLKTATYNGITDLIYTCR
ncbi:MAG TPA: dihydrofolate reductase [Candidatus Avidehalobacter gallistercoris]|uniref:Dihydrofolate reductase n=1 Tax=Candidatus Avidehalobacter gallistercoris TaxID=2840694 RepID=A0A9D1HJ79_9FIRM|nr:dihydrofolate reductase [Candidatus Avidehalobacter gallistercoris]